MFLMTGRFIVTVKESEGSSNPTTISGPVNSLKWQNSIDNYCNSAQVIIPGICRLKGHNYLSEKFNKPAIPVNQIIKTGMPIKIECGYDNKNKERFSGYVVSTNIIDSRLVIECEGYTYLLRKKAFSKSYFNPTLKQLLTDLIAGTKIKLSNKIQNVSFVGTIGFGQKRGIDVVEYLKEKCGLTIWFNGNEMYVGLKYIQFGNEVKCRVNWNIIRSDTLLYKESDIYKTEIQTRKKDGSKIIVTEGTGTTVKVNVRHIKDENYLKKLANDIRKDRNPGSYTGSIMLFLEPVLKPTDTIVLIDNDFPERSGKYFVDSVGGSFNTSGGRQEAKIGIKLQNVS